MSYEHDEKDERKAKNFTRKDYSILGLKYNVSFEEVRAAYHRLALKHHPDKGGNPIEFQKINEAYLNISNRKIKQDQKEEEFEEETTDISNYVMSKSDIKKYEDHLVYKKYFQMKHNYHDTYYDREIIRPFKLFFNINYESIDKDLSLDEIYVNIADLWNNLSRIQKRKYRGMVNTIDLYKQFETIEQLKQLLIGG